MEPTHGFINLTPHDVLVYESGHLSLTVPKSGTIARLSESVDFPRYNGAVLPEIVTKGWGVVAEVTLGAPVGLPDAGRGITYIVSMPLAMGLKAAGIDRTDVVYPFGQVRDDAGRIIGCERFARIVA